MGPGKTVNAPGILMIGKNTVGELAGNHCFINVLRAIISDPRIDFDLFLVHNCLPGGFQKIIREVIH
jgi:hypothetical protein